MKRRRLKTSGLVLALITSAVTTLALAPRASASCVPNVTVPAKVIVDVYVISASDNGTSAIVKLLRTRRGSIGRTTFGVYSALPAPKTDPPAIPPSDTFVLHAGSKYRLYADRARRDLPPIGSIPSRLLLGQCSRSYEL